MTEIIMNWAEILALKKAAIVLDALAKKMDFTAQQEAKCLADVCRKAANYFDELEIKEQALTINQSGEK